MTDPNAPAGDGQQTPPPVDSAAAPSPYAPPQGYAPSPDASAPPPQYAPPSYPGAAPQGYPGAAGAPPLPPYAAAPPPGFGGTAVAPGAPPPGAPDTRPKVLAIVALSLAVGGVLLAFIPFVTWFSGAVLLAAFIISIVALVSKKQGGKPLSIAALIVSVVGWIVAIVVAVVAALLFTVGTAAVSGGGVPEPLPSAIEEGVDEPTGEPAAPAATEIAVVEAAFGRETYDPSVWWYVVILENADPDAVYDFAEIDVEAVDASGTILDTSTDFLTLLSGRTAITGTFFEVGQGEIAALDVRGPSAADAILSPADETGVFSIADLSATFDEYVTDVTGTIGGDFQEEQQLVTVVVIARDPSGTIIGGELTYVERLPNDGTRVQFQASFLDPLPPDTVFEAYAYL